MEIITSYLKYLTERPDMVNSIILWNITMSFIYFILLKYRTRMIDGSAGENKWWESPEQWGYIWMWVAAPITCYSAYFRVELPVWVWWFNVGIAGYTIGGRWLFQWALAFKSGSNKVESTEPVKPNEVTK